MPTRLDNARTIRAPHGTTISAKSWLTEAPLRMLMNNLDPEVAEKPHELVVYGGIGRAARDWESFDRIVASLRTLEGDETLCVQSGKPVGIFRTHADAPRVLIANSNLVPHWATLDHFNELDRKGLMMYGQMTAGSWIYIGSQGIVQGTYETFVEMGRRHYGGSLAGKWILTAGLGGMGGAQPLAATMAGASLLAIECQPSRIEMRLKTGYLDVQAKDIEEALTIIERACAEKRAVSVGVLGNAAEMLAADLDEGLVGALHDALRADIDPRAGGHLAVHHQALAIELVEVVQRRPMRHDVGIGDQHPRRIGMGPKHADRLAGLHQQGFVALQLFQRGHDAVVALPVARRAADAAIDHEFVRLLGDVRIEIVHQHAERRFGLPALAGHHRTAGRADDAVVVETFVHG
jgi:hypothetical protein